VVLHVPADQELPLLQVLGQYGLAGLAPEQLLLLVQPRGPGYVWDEGLRRFMKVRKVVVYTLHELFFIQYSMSMCSNEE
jgi:hypothetical protein